MQTLLRLLPHATALEKMVPGGPLMLTSSEDFKLFPGETKLFATGVVAAVPRGVALMVRSHHDLVTKAGIFVTTGVMLIDRSCRDEIIIPLSNLGKRSYEVSRGEVIAVGSPMSTLDVPFVLLPEV